MQILNLAALLITLAALFSFVNARYLRLPTTIGLMVISMLGSLLLIGLDSMGLSTLAPAKQAVAMIDFNTTLMHGMLSFLLFAGALHVKLDDLMEQKWVISALASLGVVISTFIIGTLTWYSLGLFGLAIPYIYALLFGALISPTDPIAVMGILKTANAPKSLATKIAGESLFNDGVGVVVFLVLLGIATGGQETTFGSVVVLFVEEAVGGAVYGLLIGYLAFSLLRQVDNYQVEVLITLALVMGGYALANAIHVSGPIAMVMAGLMIGNRGRRLAMSDKTREHLDTFWELIDEILNALLFVLIGIEILVLSFAWSHFYAALLIIPITLLARFLSVGGLIIVMRRYRAFTPNVVKIMTWGGLRGGISVALALSLPAGSERDTILVITYCVVVFSILVQGLTIEKLVARR